MKKKTNQKKNINNIYQNNKKTINNDNDTVGDLNNNMNNAINIGFD
jgi:hypothetical protein